MATGVTVLSINISLFTFFPEIFNRENEADPQTTETILTPEEGISCLSMAEAKLHILREGKPDIVLMQGETANIAGDGQQVGLFLNWGPANLSEPCREFIAEDVASNWQPANGEIEPTGSGEFTYKRSSLSGNQDRIVITLSYQDQELPYTFLLNFVP